jgi:two-component system, LuxR family, response regulator FixJ
LAEGSAQVKTRQEAQGGPPSIVAVVDDDPAVCNSLKFSLELEGYEVCTYGSGAELLRTGDLGKIKCFVIDQRMPVMSGLDVIGTLRDCNITAPAILIISQPNAVLSARAEEARIPIVEKPFLGNALLDCIHEACRADA